MTEQAPGSETPRSIHERRLLVRYPAKAEAQVFRDTDQMRGGIDGELKNISVCGLGLELPVPLSPGEPIRVRLHNAVQRMEKEVCGTVRHSTPVGEGKYLVGVQLQGRLTPLEVSLFKMAAPPEGNQRWI